MAGFCYCLLSRNELISAFFYVSDNVLGRLPANSHMVMFTSNMCEGWDRDGGELMSDSHGVG